MNFYTDDNPEIIAAVAALLKCDESGIGHVRFAVSNPDNGNPSITTMEIYPVPMLQALFFIYAPGQTLRDVIAFRNNRFVRINVKGRFAEFVDRINQCVASYVPMELDEEGDEKDKLKQKDLQIQRLRDRLRVQQNSVQSLRLQIKSLKQKK